MPSNKETTGSQQSQQRRNPSGGNEGNANTERELSQQQQQQREGQQTGRPNDTAHGQRPADENTEQDEAGSDRNAQQPDRAHGDQDRHGRTN